MARIFNNRTGAEILFDPTSVGLILMPIAEPDDRPHILIELHDIDLKDHSNECPDCAQLLKDLGTSTLDWRIEFDSKTYRLDLQRVSKDPDRMINDPDISDFFDGSKLKLLIDTDTLETLEEELKKNEDLENYEHCVFLRDRIARMKAEANTGGGALRGE